MVNDSSVKVAYWIRNIGMGKPNMGLDFTYYLYITWYRACAMQILSINMEILGPLNIYRMVKHRDFIVVVVAVVVAAAAHRVA